jgi:predicted nucleotidyltransferase
MVAKATKDLEPNAKVYVIGGVAEDRITVLSDIDILIVTRMKIEGREKRELKADIMIRAMDIYGLPFDAPVELHLEDEEGAKRFFQTSKKVIKIV